MGIIKWIVFVLVVAMPIAYADLGGSFPVMINVVDDNSDDTDDNSDQDDQTIDTEIYYKVYSRAVDVGERELPYAYTGEAVHLEVYVQHDDEVDDVLIEIDDEEIDCKRKGSQLDDGDNLGDYFSDDAEYDSETMDYYKCSFIVDESLSGEEEIEIRALNDDNTIEKESEDWMFNPRVTVEVSEDDGDIRVENEGGLLLSVGNMCSDSVVELEPDEDEEISIADCDEDYVIVSVK